MSQSRQEGHSESVLRALGLVDGPQEEMWPQPSATDFRVADQRVAEAEPYMGNLDLAGFGLANPANLRKALDLYQQGLKKLFKGRGQTLIPGRSDCGYRNAFYTKLSNPERETLASLCQGVAQCLGEMQRDEEEARVHILSLILQWLDEIELIHMNFFCRDEESHRFGRSNQLLPALFQLNQRQKDWHSSHHAPEEIATNRAFGLTQTTTLLKNLGNTGRAQHIQSTADRFLRSNGYLHQDTTHLEALLHISQPNRSELLKLLHPDPFWKRPREDLSPGFCREGGWTKLPIQVNEAMGRRGNHAAFIWKSHLYVIGGVKNPESEVHGSDVYAADVWRLDLEQPKRWEFLCKSPLPKSLRWQSFRTMRVYNDKAYLFWGDPEVHYYDLRTEKWGSFTTVFIPTEEDRKLGVGGWPWGGDMAFHSAQEFVKGRLLCFGGGHDRSRAGMNVLMELNLETRLWRRLSGFRSSYQVRNYPGFPPGRTSPGSWVSKDQRKFYILFGESSRGQPPLSCDQYAPEIPWTHDDLWSWDVVNRQWRRERICGNPPAPRAYMGCVYNEKLDRVIVYGGRNIMNEHESPRTRKKSDSVVYSDAFIWQPPPTDNIRNYNGQYRWQQVISQGYPTHRAHHQLICDPDTGKIYLYGGIGKTALTPSKTKSNFRVFGDVWQLHLDVPGGDFGSINWKNQARIATLGPWKCCFNCSKVGKWKKCGGSCGGKAFFCNSNCLTRGWEDHKKLHGCRKYK